MQSNTWQKVSLITILLLQVSVTWLKIKNRFESGSQNTPSNNFKIHCPKTLPKINNYRKSENALFTVEMYSDKGYLYQFWEASSKKHKFPRYFNIHHKTSLCKIARSVSGMVVYKVVEIVSLKSDTPNFHEARILFWDIIIRRKFRFHKSRLVFSLLSMQNVHWWFIR